MVRARAPAAAILAAVRALARAPAKVLVMRAVGRALPAARPAAAEVTASRDSQLKYRPKTVFDRCRAAGQALFATCQAEFEI
jgi:hypothetical protein